VGPTKPSIQQVRGTFLPWAKRKPPEVDHSSPPSAKDKKGSHCSPCPVNIAEEHIYLN
jgi:hypothetical protein